ncbi:DUF6507 family protein [Streptomyces roseochromogenus]|uniref:DUF6507 family protein n=1 Tax=Streptomyces roseochromogenus TaxID=285450 RepID=UPI0031591CCF
MSGWDLHPQGIDHVLTATGKTASHLEQQAKDYGTHLQSAASSAGRSPRAAAPGARAVTVVTAATAVRVVTAARAGGRRRAVWWRWRCRSMRSGR